MEEMADSGTSRSVEIMSDSGPVLYEEYRSICDASDKFRKIGIQSEDSYRQVLNDPDTVFAKNADGSMVPTLAPIHYEKMYDPQKCSDLTSRSKVMLLCVPVEKLGGALELVQEIDSDSAIIVEEFIPEGGDSDDVERIVMNAIGGSFHRKDFIHSDLAAYPGHDTAWMAAYVIDIESGSEYPTPLIDANELALSSYEIWKSIEGHDLGVIPDKSSTGTFFFRPEQLASNQDIVDDLWAISELGFGDVLGASHPVSMQFNRDFFDQQITSDGTLTAVHYVDGEAMCFGFVSLDMSKNDWINVDSNVIRELSDEANVEGKVMMHFYELISRGDAGMGYSSNILSTFLSVASESQLGYRIFFESTNLSSLYIPSIAESEVARKGLGGGKVKQIGKLSYWAAVGER